MLSPAAADHLAVVVFGAIAAALLIAFYRRLRSSPLSAPQTLLWWLNYLLTRLLWRTTVEGRFELPPGKGAVLVANHRSSLDPSFLEMAIPRVVHWMVAREYCESLAFGWFLKTCEVIPTNRAGVDTAATKQAIRWAERGELVGIFPEGRINDTDATLYPGRPGAALIALRAGVPIVPCYIDGAPFDEVPWSPLLMPARVRLIVGRPIELGEYAKRSIDRPMLEEITRRILLEMATLGGDPDFEPQLAGRFYRT